MFLFESIFRCNFFVIVFLECLSEVSGLNKGRFLLLVFFNILIRVRKECKYELIENEIDNEKCDIKKKNEIVNGEIFDDIVIVIEKVFECFKFVKLVIVVFIIELMF